MQAGLLVGARLLQYLGALVLLGGSVFHLLVFRSASHESATEGQWPGQRLMALIAALVALIGALFWLAAETALMNDDPGAALNPTVLWTILTETRFGLACSGRIFLLLLSIAANVAIGHASGHRVTQAILGAAITMSFAWTGHGAVEISKTGGLHLVTDLLHLLAAGVWIGALVPLTMMTVRAKRSDNGLDAYALYCALNSFSAIGLMVVAVLVLSGIFNSLFLLGPSPWAELLTSQYGIVLTAKLGLFGIMLAMAALNRYRLSPALGRALDLQGARSFAVMTLHKALLKETGLAVLVLVAVSFLGDLPPPMMAN